MAAEAANGLPSEHTTIGDLCDEGVALIQTGPFGSQLHAHDYCPVGTPVIPTEAIGRGRILDVPLPKVGPEVAARLSRHALQEGDILFARRGAQATGLSALVEPAHAGSLCSTGAILLRFVDRSRVLPEYLAHALSAQDSVTWLKDNAVGAVMPNLNANIIRRLPIRVPALSDQRSIAHILGAIDDKIELNRRTNETLEAMARALFKSWFVDFDPVRAKATGTGPAGMNAATAALFPSEFVESSIGRIPKGWRATRLGETYAWSRAGVDPADSPTASFEHFSLPAFDAGKSPSIDLGATIKSLKFLVVPNSVLVSKLNPAICRAWLPFPSGRGTAVSSTEFLVAVANASVPRAWLYGAFLSEPVREAMIGQASGTSNSHQRVRPDDIDAIAVALGDEKLLARYDAIAGPLHDKSNSLRVESVRLAQIRDALLPRLLSGELRIPDAERIVGPAT